MKMYVAVNKNGKAHLCALRSDTVADPICAVGLAFEMDGVESDPASVLLGAGGCRSCVRYYLRFRSVIEFPLGVTDVTPWVSKLAREGWTAEQIAERQKDRRRARFSGKGRDETVS